ncbi:type II toxin-antitoxin system RelE/ParE family toxin [Vibrio hippocampi]|uniref:Type II toxin-antitoxin system RelE/ParE family toxin n=1 Tax=Vibrio hippocampi TaxID=654686 RepID=A0ABN8DP31_9VIBR|nr:type II toxin-antitoxin system RelE/ParE family toxin [Vibrio hippocampi]CAH0529952.1 hypothetical protein VHP8226_03683 [Vibrio hippocampi]
MSNNLDIIYTETFEILLDKLIIYLSDFASEAEVIERIERLINRFEKIITVDAHAVGVSPSLLELGVINYREFHADTFKIIYRIDPTKNDRVIVDVIAQQKQNLEALLIQYCLLHIRK